MRILLRTLAAVLLVIGCISVYAAEFPPQWPWRGISIEDSGFYPADLAKIAQRVRINSVQLRLIPRRRAQREGVPVSVAWTESIRWADEMLDECAHLGLVAILTVEGFPLDPDATYNQTSPRFWIDSKDLDEVANVATDLSRHFSRRGKELVAYQLLSEPVVLVGGKSLDPPDWLSLAGRIISSIRKYDPNRWIAIAPGPWGLPSSYADFKPLTDARIIYGAHMYVPHPFTHQGIRQWQKSYRYPGVISGKYWNLEALKESMQPLRKFQQEYQVPVWIGEFSAVRWADGGNQYIRDLISTFDEYGWSWTYFSLNGWFGWSPDYDSKKPDPPQTWPSHWVGFNSDRWNTLISLLNVKVK